MPKSQTIPWHSEEDAQNTDNQIIKQSKQISLHQPIRTASANSVESDLGCISRIYFHADIT